MSDREAGEVGEAHEQLRWYDPDSGTPEDRANDLLRYVLSIEEHQADLHQTNFWYAQLYTGRDLRAFDWGLGVSDGNWIDPTMENLVRSNGKILQALVGKNQVKGSVVVRDGSWTLWRMGQLLERWLWGEASTHGIFEKGAAVFDDGYIAGLSAARVDWNAKKGCLEVSRVFFDDIIVDENEGRAGETPRHYSVRRVQPAEVVLARYRAQLPGVTVAELVACSNRDTAVSLGYRGRDEKWVTLIETWRLPDDDGPGRHTIATHDHLLLDEPWTDCWVPLVFFRYDPLTSGFRGAGGVEPAVPYQVRLNEVNDVIKAAQDIVARPRMIAAKGSLMDVHDLDNQIAKVLYYTGMQKPEALTWQAVPTELYNERARIKQECRRDLGIPDSAVNGAVPANSRMDSSAALREMTAIGEDYFTPLAQRLEAFYLNLYRTMIRVRAKAGGSGKAQWVDRKRGGIAEIDWSAVAELKEGDYQMELAASSVINMSPAAREDRLNTWLAEGKITPEEYRKQMAHPDLESLVSLAEAAGDDIERTLEDLLDGKFRRPTPLQDLVKGVQRVHLEYLRVSRFPDVPRKVLQAMERWMRAARGILETGAEEPPTAPAEMTAGVPAAVTNAAAPGQPGMAPPMGPPGMPGPMGPAGPLSGLPL